MPREEVFITSKIAPFQQGTAAARKSIASSLASLQVTSSKTFLHTCSNLIELCAFICCLYALMRTPFPSLEMVCSCLKLVWTFALQTDFLDLCLIHWPGASRVASSSPENARLRHETCATRLQHCCLCLTVSAVTDVFTPPGCEFVTCSSIGGECSRMSTQREGARPSACRTFRSVT